VTDNAIGLPADFKLDSSHSMGMQVVASLIHQLRANLVISSDGGANFQFSWKLSNAKD